MKVTALIPGVVFFCREFACSSHAGEIFFFNSFLKSNKLDIVDKCLETPIGPVCNES